MISTSSSASASTTAAIILPGQIDAALQRIPPLWPLKHFVAVNPFLGMVDRPFTEACELLQRTTGAAPLQEAADYNAAYNRGEITAEDLAAVTDERWSAARLLDALRDSDTSPRAEPAVLTVAEELDADLPHAHWSSFVVNEISKWCGVWFDDNQTTWRAPRINFDLFAAWQDAARYDHNPEVFGLNGFRATVSSLPTAADAVIETCIARLLPPGMNVTDFLHRQLWSIAGWAGHVQYRVREDALRGQSNPMLRELLAIRLAYDLALFEAFGDDPVFRANWQRQRLPSRTPSPLEALVYWQNAYEHALQRRLAGQLASGAESSATTSVATPDVQAIFCIDVRSEVMRRHLESASPGIETIGFAGFFGFPLAHQEAGQPDHAARCPALLVPPVKSEEPVLRTEAPKLRAKQAATGAWKAFQNSAISCFTFVESVGLGFASSLAKRDAKAKRTCSRVAPRLTDNLTTDQRADLAEGALRNMSLTERFARLVLVCGHGSVSANNPYASGLDCGACGGHAGDVNARLATQTLNDPEVRMALAQRGIALPSHCHFIAGLHNTTTDEVELLDTEDVPASHQVDLTRLQTHLEMAGALCRAERAPALGLELAAPHRLLQQIRARGCDTSQVRPEWGLANNAAIVIAPRRRTTGLNLEGRVFLHDYEASRDTEGNVLNLILSAPVVVASWINLQYYASRVDPERYGAGNKTLHNIMGGIGAVEGNSGDLRVGLPLQSIHDGEQFRHEPRRLSVFVEAPVQAIEAVLSKQPAVRQLFDHGWIHLFAIRGDRVIRRTETGWESQQATAI